jgi:antiviral helicase SKI2
MRDLVRRFGQVQEECGIDLEFDVADGVDFEGSMCRWALADVVLEWARGAPFAKIATLTDIQEGDIVVCVKRLVELLKDAMNVARAVGNEELLASLEAATESIRRDIIFSGSLYLD